MVLKRFHSHLQNFSSIIVQEMTINCSEEIASLSHIALFHNFSSLIYHSVYLLSLVVSVLILFNVHGMLLIISVSSSFELWLSFFLFLYFISSHESSPSYSLPPYSNSLPPYSLSLFFLQFFLHPCKYASHLVHKYISFLFITFHKVCRWCNVN